jgi:predicted O-methyltransferase YrrM
LSVIDDPRLKELLDGLHAKSDGQIAELERFWAGQAVRPSTEDAIKAFRSDKLVALDRDKAELCYQLCRAIDARRIVEIGTSFGISTLYLAAAVRDNIRASGGTGIVIGTEYEPAKANAARAHFGQAGLGDLIDLREGDLRETLRGIEGGVDFTLVDIWIPMARPALELVTPHLRRGAIVICDNTARFRTEYSDYFAFLESSGFRTMTLPFDGGLELSIRC